MSNALFLSLSIRNRHLTYLMNAAAKPNSDKVEMLIVKGAYNKSAGCTTTCTYHSKILPKKCANLSETLNSPRKIGWEYNFTAHNFHAKNRGRNEGKKLYIFSKSLGE